MPCEKKGDIMPSKKRVRRILNCLPSKYTERDWTIEDAVASKAAAAPRAIPASVDLRETWWAIGDQGATGSCVGWASADGLLRWHFAKAGRLAKSERLSVRFLWMAAKETDEFASCPTTFIEEDGTSLKAALDIARKYGAVRDDVLPFRSAALFQGSTTTFYAIAARLKIASYFNLGRGLEDWRRWLATEGPILTRLDVDDTWMNAKATKGRLAKYDASTASGGHAVVLAGYTTDAFIVRNSWGAALWGDEGFGYASIDYARSAFTEAYGVTI